MKFLTLMQLQEYPYSPTPAGWAQPGVYPPVEFTKPPGYSPQATTQPGDGCVASGSGLQQQQQQILQVQPATGNDRHGAIQCPPPPYKS